MKTLEFEISFLQDQVKALAEKFDPNKSGQDDRINALEVLAEKLGDAASLARNIYEDVETYTDNQGRKVYKESVGECTFHCFSLASLWDSIDAAKDVRNDGAITTYGTGTYNGD